MTFLVPQTVVWVCPNCTSRCATQGVPPKPVMHPCRGLVGLLAPMVREGLNCKVEALEREDYTNGDIPHYDREGRAVMAIETTRDDGTDRCVLVPTATMSREEFHDNRQH